jgi:hypothetical protein
MDMTLPEKTVLGGNNIVEYKNFLSEEDCKRLIDFYNAKEERWMPICFYGSYGMGVSEPLDKPHGTGIDNAWIDSLKQKFTDAMLDSQGRACKINSIHAQKWHVGAYANDHSDNSDLDGNPSGWNDNKFFSGLYLNTNYEGGVLTFRDHGFGIKPETGSLITMAGGVENIHKVTEITEGVRYTLIAFWDYVEQEYTQEQLDWRESDIARERVYQAKLKIYWKYGYDDPVFASDEEKYAEISDEEKARWNEKISRGDFEGIPVPLKLKESDSK